MSINLGDACDLPCFKLCNQEHLLEFTQRLIGHLSSQNHHLSFLFLPAINQKDGDLDLALTHICAAEHQTPLKRQAGQILV